MSGTFINVAVPPLEPLFTYAVPETMEPPAVGTGLTVPFGARRCFGYVVESPAAAPTTTAALKSIEPAPQPPRCFAPWQLPFFRWIADYYGESLARTIETAVPRPVATKHERFVEFVRDDEQPLRGKLQQELLHELKCCGAPVDYALLVRRASGAQQALKALERKGLIRITTQAVRASHAAAAPEWAKRDVALDAHQQAALETITAACTAGEFAPVLLHGVTGSGKTEVYIDAINKIRALGRGALVIVPEIALTPQLIDRFAARVGPEIAVLHSGLPPRERWDAWQALLEQRVSIAIGARSGVFAPIERLGLIVVDEEHDGSYKQADGLRYNARDVAVKLAQLHRCPVVLGSATPSLESYYNARTGKYRYLKLPQRHDSGSGTNITLVDMNRYKPRELISKNISPVLHTALQETIERGAQAFILYNRRGFAAYLQCDRCNAVLECPNCSVTLTLHRSDNSLKCHYCSYQSPVFAHCPKCRSAHGDQAPQEIGTLSERGAGTEKVFEELQELFPQTVLARLDRDAVSQPWKYREILEQVRRGQTQVLVGTQMIAKGHDLPGVTLVGIIDCDVGLHMPDFRAGERVFQLLTQAAGRAGRGAQQGQVVLQTRVPLHPSLVKTVAKDFEGFARLELSGRKELRYPPFTRMLRIVASAEDAREPALLLQSFRDKAAAFTAAEGLAVQILGPCAAPLQRLRGRWRWHLLCKAQSVSALAKVMRRLRAEKITSRKVRVGFDLDPQDLL